MYKKKEIIIIISIIILTLLLAFLPNIINSTKKKNKVIKKEEYSSIYENNNIDIRVQGEVFFFDGKNYVNYYEANIPKGSSYGYIIQKINVYLTKYKKIDFSLYTNRYYESTTIIIESYDDNFEVETIEESEYIININTANKYELMSIFGIGDKRSDTIIEYRSNKKIEDFSELQKVIGVSDEVIERIKEKAVCE